MSKQAENFKLLVRGATLDSTIQGIKFLRPSVREELMKEYNTSLIRILAIKLIQG